MRFKDEEEKVIIPFEFLESFVTIMVLILDKLDIILTCAGRTTFLPNLRPS